jgi:hypothetical protein
MILCHETKNATLQDIRIESQTRTLAVIKFCCLKRAHYNMSKDLNFSIIFFLDPRWQEGTSL